MGGVNHAEGSQVKRKGGFVMKRRRRHQHGLIDSLPDDWSDELQVRLYRIIEDSGTCRYLGTMWAYDGYFSSDVAARFGGGAYWFVAIRRGRVVRKGRFDLEGEPLL